MKREKMFVVVIYLIMFVGFGYMWGYDNGSNKYKELYEILLQEYDGLEAEYRFQLDSCYQQMGDMQEDYDVNNDGVVDGLDFVALKKYLLSNEVSK